MPSAIRATMQGETTASQGRARRAQARGQAAESDDNERNEAVRIGARTPLTRARARSTRSRTPCSQ
eukprot:7356667-Alexandrium_andersonii.AAC.1